MDTAVFVLIAKALVYLCLTKQGEPSIFIGIEFIELLLHRRVVFRQFLY
jgi:Na+-transporting methylmalonyl-CoA/oxaloacetate decarboxylase beta subunit